VWVCVRVVCTCGRSRSRQTLLNCVAVPVFVHVYVCGYMCVRKSERECVCARVLMCAYMCGRSRSRMTRGGGLGSSTIFKKFNEPYAPS